MRCSRGMLVGYTQSGVVSEDSTTQRVTVESRVVCKSIRVLDYFDSSLDEFIVARFIHENPTKTKRKMKR